MTVPTVSLVILGYKRFQQYTRACLESLLPWQQDSRFQFLVLDNGSDDDSAQEAAAWCAAHSGFQFVDNQKNLGFAGGMNAGAALANGSWLLLVNNDTLFPAGALDALVRVLAALPDKVAVLGPVTNQAGNGQYLAMDHLSPEQCVAEGQKLMAQPTGKLHDTHRADFFCVAIRKAVWDQLNGLDTAFGLGYYEDFDFSLRVKKAGYQECISEDVFIAHVGSATFKASPLQKQLLKKNKQLLQSKHPQVNFYHRRDGNVAVLNDYVAIKAAGAWNEALELRLHYRRRALQQDEPRSPIKRFLWRYKTRLLRRELVN